MASDGTNYCCMLTKPKTIEIQNISVPQMGKDDVLIRVESTGICGSDLHNYNSGAVGTDVMTGPIILGHESAGTVTKVGASVSTVAVGDRVAIEPTMFCRRCMNCKTGRTNVCRNFRQASIAPTNGTLSQYYVCESDFTVKIPESLSWEEAGCIQPLAVAIHLAKRAKFSAGQTLAVFGCGPLGCLVMAVAKALGLSKIVAFDILPKRVEFAKKLWADHASLPPKRADNEDYAVWAKRYKATALEQAGIDPWGVDVSVEASGAEECIHAGIAFLHSGGTYVQAGLGPMINSFPSFEIVAREILVVGTVRYTAGCFQTAIDLLESGKIDLKPMITAVFPLTKCQDAIETLKRGNDLKVVIMNQQV